ncbi:hypothetical protein, conserved [Entamoeba dispar SAW760]|uniref:Uncharacterized protein n=1 Tax=Entamoeba dispar (strain ATCC PRA-260 / SAW760) TaxID=370354 RepID=B0ECS4_ENTDS|nr:uncharacterized protein EDI_277870 [Entamoeba dispar SAW760]EDR27616.1 hypothetical protein, conserved [Entamoeba dispar SAW760]|eukprot:EDR27616.1 hypothetical protein, conserved [Entamoeba dispar SAW760]
MNNQLVSVQLEDYVKYKSIQKEIELIVKENIVIEEEIQSREKEIEYYTNMLKEKDEEISLLFSQTIQTKSENEVISAKCEILKKQYKEMNEPSEDYETKKPRRGVERKRKDKKEKPKNLIEKIVSEDIVKAKTPKPNEEIGKSWVMEGSSLLNDEFGESDESEISTEKTKRVRERKKKGRDKRERKTRQIKEVKDFSSESNEVRPEPKEEIKEEVKMEEDEEEWEVSTTTFGSLPIPFIVNYSLIMEIIGNKFEKREDVVIYKGYPSILTLSLFKEFSKLIELGDLSDTTGLNKNKEVLEKALDYFEKCINYLEQKRIAKGLSRNLVITKDKTSHVQFIGAGKKK